MLRSATILSLLLLMLSLLAPSAAQESLAARLARTASQYAAEKQASLSMGLKFLDNDDCVSVNAGAVVPAASLIKLLIAVEIFRQAEEGALSLDDRMVMRESDRVDGGPLFARDAGTPFTVRELVEAMLVVSDNTATNMLIDRVGMARVNACGASLGLERTALQRKMMDFASLERGVDNVTCASDMVHLLDRIVRGTAMAPERCREMLAILKRQHWRTRIPKLLPPGVEVANKTGELPGGVGCEAAVVWHPARPYILCIFSRGLTEDDYALLSKSLYDLISAP